MWSFCIFYFFFHTLSIGTIKFQKFHFFVDYIFCWRQQVFTLVRSANIDIFILGTLRLHFNQKFACNTNVYMRLCIRTYWPGLLFVNPIQAIISFLCLPHWQIKKNNFEKCFSDVFRFIVIETGEKNSIVHLI